MKIGIITFHFVKNYGALFQAYALQRYLSESGHDVEFIDYRPDWVENGGRFRFQMSGQALRSNLVILYQKIMKLRGRWSNGREFSEACIRFQYKHLITGNRAYRTLEQLKECPPEYDVYICGSDQVWNPSVQFGVDAAYFLDFGRAKRVAYAASFGRPEIEEEHKDRIAGLLKSFSGIGVRERSGAELVKRLSGREAAWVPDPTLLLKDYSQVIKYPVRENAYVFSYILRSSNGIREVQRLIVDQLNVEILVPYNPHRRWKEENTEVVCSPEDWIGYIRCSSFVVTNSFHGTLFSVIFEKPFVFIGLTGGKAELNERSVSLLERIGLSDRIVDGSDAESVVRLVSEGIDWAKVRALKEEWVSEAKAFLCDALTGG